MRPPIRKVCGGCLRSVEVPSPGSITSGEPSWGECPHCGGAIESRSDNPSKLNSDSDPTDLGGIRAFSRDGTHETIDWTETWTRGSLGTIGRFQLRERLGEGGFGQVFLAFDPRLDRDVALKVLREPDPSERVMQRFFREARAAARLDHPNIVAVHDAGFENGRCWIAYQYIRGRPLWWFRNHQSPDCTTSARIIRDLADALNHAHGLGVLHRDLKPANVIMDERGQPRLTDFGLARRADLDSSLTHDGAMVGTPAYMSPEQAQGQSRNVDDRSDIYSLGVIFHELLYGSLPPNPSEQSRSSADASPVPRIHGAGFRFLLGARRRPSVPFPLKRICEQTLATSPEERYPDARSLVDDLDRWLSRGKVRPVLGRSRVLAPALLAIGGAVLICIGLIARFWPAPQRADALNVQAAPPKAQALLQSPPADTAIATASMPKLLPTPVASKMKDLNTASDRTVVANRSNRIFHKPESTCVKLMLERNQQGFDSVSDASKEGYRACDKCFRD